MRIRTTLAATGIALGLTVAGAAAANAAQTPDGWSPAQWTHRTMMTVSGQEDPTGDPADQGPWGDGVQQRDGSGSGFGMREGGTGDPTTCPYADEATTDRLQDRDRDRIHDQDGTGTAGQERMRDRMHATS